MSNTNIIVDQYISDNIISYLNIHKRIFINKYHYKQSKKILKLKVNLIQKFYLKNKLRLSMLFEYFDNENIIAIRNYYILFYPKEFRKPFFQQVLRLRMLFRRDKYLIICALYEKSNISDNYNKYFKNLINSLSVNDLANLGW